MSCPSLLFEVGMRTTIPMTLYRGASCKADIQAAECVTVYSQEELDAALSGGFVDYFTAVSGATKPTAEVPQQAQEVAKRRGRPRKEENAR
jgi:hypothetical protein